MQLQIELEGQTETNIYQNYNVSKIETQVQPF